MTTRVKVVKVVVARMPCSCIYDCPFVLMDVFDYKCGLLNRSVRGRIASISSDCPLTVDKESEVTSV